MKIFSIVPLIAVLFVMISCNDSSTRNDGDNDSTATSKEYTLKEDKVTYTADNVSMNGYVVFSDSIKGKRPAVLVVHEWWGQNDYARNRVKQLADMGYIAMAVDMFGNGQTASTPDEAMKLAGPFYQNPAMIKSRFDAALAKLKTYPETDTSNIAAIGYCYGGFIVLNAAKLGADLKGVVSFHGNLAGVPPSKNLKSKVLVCHGEADPYVSNQEVATFKKQMDSVGADYTFKSYPGAKHAFTNPDATENGKKFKMDIAYNEEADKNSWQEMKRFFSSIFK